MSNRFTMVIAAAVAAALFCAPVAHAEEYTGLFARVVTDKPAVNGNHAGTFDLTVTWDLPDPPGVQDPGCFTEWQMDKVVVEIRRGRYRDGEVALTLTGSGKSGSASGKLPVADFFTGDSGYTAWIKGYATRQTIQHPMCIWGHAVDPAQEVETDVPFSAPYLDHEECVLNVAGGQGRITAPGSTQPRQLRRGDTVPPGARVTSRNGRLNLTAGRASLSVNGTLDLQSVGKCRRRPMFSVRLTGSLRLLVEKGLPGPAANIQISTANARTGVRSAARLTVGSGGTTARPRTTLSVERGAASFYNPSRAAVKRTVGAGQRSSISGSRGTPTKPKRHRR